MTDDKKPAPIDPLTEAERENWPKQPLVPLEKPFVDVRGAIQPLVDEMMRSAVLIESAKGTLRANHYHKTDWHYCYVLEGAIEYFHRPTGSVPFNVLNNTTFTDIYSCYLLYRRGLVDAERLTTTGWEQHAEILTQAVGKARSMYEVPISYYGRTYDEGKKIKARHIVAVIWTIFVKRLNR